MMPGVPREGEGAHKLEGYDCRLACSTTALDKKRSGQYERIGRDGDLVLTLEPHSYPQGRDVLLGTV